MTKLSGKTQLQNVFTRAAWTLSILFSLPALAVTELKFKNIPYQYNTKVFRPSLNLELETTSEKLTLDANVAKKRAFAGKSNSEVEPLSLYLSSSASELKVISNELGLAGKTTSLYQALKRAYKKSDAEANSKGQKKIALPPDVVKYMNLEKYADSFFHTHQNVEVETQPLRKDKDLRFKLAEQVGPYLQKQGLADLLKKIRSQERLSLDTDLLPDFARKTVGTYTAYRGPNCFHAAMAFQGSDFVRSPYFNVKREEGYHKAMINYDELWRTLQTNFYEVDPAQAELEYGDVLVFFDIPKDTTRSEPYFRWIRHASTYLLGRYTFSKGSKSPDTPYSVKTIEEEWQAWSKFTKRLGLKVYRRLATDRIIKPYKSLEEWNF